MLILHLLQREGKREKPNNSFPCLLYVFIFSFCIASYLNSLPLRFDSSFSPLKCLWFPDVYPMSLFFSKCQRDIFYGLSFQLLFAKACPIGTLGFLVSYKESSLNTLQRSEIEHIWCSTFPLLFPMLMELIFVHLFCKWLIHIVLFLKRAMCLSHKRDTILTQRTSSLVLQARRLFLFNVFLLLTMPPKRHMPWILLLFAHFTLRIKHPSVCLPTIRSNH